MSDDARFFKKTSESVANAGASAAGAVSGSLSLNAGSSSKKTTTTTTSSGGAGQPAQGPIDDGGASQQKKLTQREADAQYEERMEDEYAKREGGA